MRRFLQVAFVALVPFGLVAASVVWLWRLIFNRDDEPVSAKTMREILAREHLAQNVREADEMTRGKRTVLDGPARPSRAFDRVVGR
jgi:hypothetical protein